MGRETAITYEEIAAYNASQGISALAIDSQGVETGGYMVDWDRATGFTGAGWDTGTSTSPLYGKTEEEIQAEIDANGNLTTSFKAWADRVGLGDRLLWVGSWQKQYPGCVTEV